MVDNEVHMSSHKYTRDHKQEEKYAATLDIKTIVRGYTISRPRDTIVLDPRNVRALSC